MKAETQKENENIEAKVVELGKYIRKEYGPEIDYEQMQKVLLDPACVFHKTKMVFDDHPLREGEFAYMHQVDANPSKGFMLYMHPCFKDDENALPYLMAYHLVVVNFGREAPYEMAEKLGATIFGMNEEAYYQKVLSLYEKMTSS